jgi:hypothetical protein
MDGWERGSRRRNRDSGTQTQTQKAKMLEKTKKSSMYYFSSRMRALFHYAGIISLRIVYLPNFSSVFCCSIGIELRCIQPRLQLALALYCGHSEGIIQQHGKPRTGIAIGLWSGHAMLTTTAFIRPNRKIGGCLLEVSFGESHFVASSRNLIGFHVSKPKNK